MQPRRRRPSAPSPASTPAPIAASTPPALLTTIEVARLLRVHPKQIYRLFDRGLPRRRVGSEWRFEREEVLRWTTDGTRESMGSPPAATAPLLACNGDAAVELLLRRVRSSPGTLLGVVEADRETGLALLMSGRVLATGFHGDAFPSHLPQAHLPQMRLARLHLVRRQIGLVAKRRARPHLEAVATSRLASRPPTAGLRRTLDRALTRAGDDSAAIHATARICATHLDVVNAVAAGEADVGIATGAWARRLGLSFVELQVEDYGLLLRAEHLGRQDVVRMCEVAQDAVFHGQLAAEAGYDAAGSGAIRLDAAIPLPPTMAAPR